MPKVLCFFFLKNSPTIHLWLTCKCPSTHLERTEAQMISLGHILLKSHVFTSPSPTRYSHFHTNSPLPLSLPLFLSPFTSHHISTPYRPTSTPSFRIPYSTRYYLSRDPPCSCFFIFFLILIFSLLSFLSRSPSLNLLFSIRSSNTWTRSIS